MAAKWQHRSFYHPNLHQIEQLSMHENTLLKADCKWGMTARGWSTEVRRTHWGGRKDGFTLTVPPSPGSPVWGDTFLLRQGEYSEHPVIPRALQRTQPSTRLTPVALDGSLWDPGNPGLSPSTWGLQKPQAAQQPQMASLAPGAQQATISLDPGSL